MFKGIYSAIFSVYDKDMNVIPETVKKMVDYQLDNGLKGFYVGGNTGECAVLPNKTRIQMLEEVVKSNNGRGQIMAHIGAGHYDDVMELLDHANNMDIDAIASLPPSLMGYYKRDEIIDYYKMLAKLSKHPVYAYITGVLTCDFVEFGKELAKIDNVAGIKLTIPDYYRFGQVTQIKDFNILNGPDECLGASLLVGADGAIGTTYNILPKLSVNIYNAFLNNDLKTMRENQNKMNSFINTLVKYGSLSYWKGALSLLGYDMGYTVFPCRMPQKEDLANLKEELERIDFFNLVK